MIARELISYKHPGSSKGLAARPRKIMGSLPTASGVTHVIFDMDGLLLDTEKFYSVAQQTILEKHGRQFSWDLKAKMMGKKALEAAQVLINETDLHGQLTAEQFLKQREEILDKLFPTSELMPGA